MPSVYDLKPRFQNLLRPVIGGLVRIGLTANHITVIAMLLSLLVGASLYRWHQQRAVFWVLPIFLFVRMALNAIDGMMAREHHMKTELGALLNEIGDVVSDTALYLPLGFIGVFNPVWVASLVVLAALTEFAGVMGQAMGKSRRYEGPMGKSDRALVFGILGILLALDIPTDRWATALMAVLAVLLGTTIVNRCRHTLRE